MIATYPEVAGCKTGDTSRSAAIAITKKGRVDILRNAIMRLLSTGDYTADEAAKMLREKPFSIRPRFSELRKMGLIQKSGKTRRNESNSPAIVWRLLRDQQELAI